MDLDIDDSELNLNKDVEHDSDVQEETPKGKKPPRGRAIPRGAKAKTKSNDLNDKKMLYYVVGGVVAISLLGGVFMLSSNASSKKQLAEKEQQEMMEQQAELEKNKNKSDVSAGIPSLYGQGKTDNSSSLTSSDQILKDLNGNTVPPNYSIREQKTVTDYINYTKYRATTGDGMEFYWLEAIYKKQPYKVQVPYSIYSRLDNEGITVVDAEILVLENGGEIVSYMSVRKDAKSLLEQ